MKLFGEENEKLREKAGGGGGRVRVEVKRGYGIQKVGRGEEPRRREEIWFDLKQIFRDIKCQREQIVKEWWEKCKIK